MAVSTTSVIKWDGVHPSLHWARPMMESILGVFARPRYGFALGGSTFKSESTQTFSRQRGCQVHHSLRGDFSLERQGNVSFRLTFTVTPCGFRFGLSHFYGYDRDPPVKELEFGLHRGRKFKRHAKFGRLKRPSVRKWAIYAVQKFLKLVADEAATTVMES